MPTKFKEGTSVKRQALFHAYAFAVNSTEIGVWAAAGISTSVASDLNVDSVVRKGATIAACYLVPAAPMYTVVKNLDRAAALGKRAYTYGSIAHRFAINFTSPVELVNYLANKGLTRVGATELMKKWCKVEESDSFYWERPEHQHRL